MAYVNEGKKKKIPAGSFILFCHRLASTLPLIERNGANGMLLCEKTDGRHLMLSRHSAL